MPRLSLGARAGPSGRVASRPSGRGRVGREGHSRGGASMPSGGDVTADHGAAGGPCRSRPGDEVRRAPARRPMKPCTES